MNIAEYIADQLFKEGVRYVFGIPGGPSIPYMEAFRAAGIEFILTSNEAAAAIMADVTARLTGTPGICHATYGPGATNISTGIGGALLDRSPVIVFTSEIEDKMIGRTTQMNISHQELFRPITKATFRLNAAEAEVMMEEALAIIREEYPGPVHIGLPSDISGSELHLRGNKAVSDRPENPSNDLKMISSLLENSKRPLLAVGLTAARHGLKNELLELLENFRMPVVVTPMAKGLIPEDHSCYAGVLFHCLSDYLEDIYEETDLVIGLGYDPVEFNYESWKPDVPLVHFDVKKTDMPAEGINVQFSGQPGDWFAMLRNLRKDQLTFDEGAISHVRDEMESVFNGFTGHFGPSAALKILRDELPRGVILTADVGSHLHLAGQFWNTWGRQNLIMTNGWSGMGFGLPAALAAQLNSRERTVVCLTGDGGFLMMAGEILTARRYNLPVIIVVLADGELNLIKVKQSWKDLSPYGTLLFQGDLFAADRFLGVRVLNAFDSETMRHAVITALSMNEPVIINAAIDPGEYKWLIVKR